jgi:prepilin-type N-terminal cleavage/methylation domain-containing protein
MKNRRGFTLIEILVVMSIAAIVYAFGFAIYKSWNEQVILTNKVDELKSALVRTQQLAMTAADNSNWGLHVATTSYTMFPGSFYDENRSGNQTWLLDGVAILNPDNTFFNGVSGYGPNVVFVKFTGQTNNTGTVAMYPVTNPTIIKNVTVQPSGQIY